MILSDLPRGSSSSLWTSSDFIANPTPDSRFTPSGLPFQKNVYPSSSRLPSPERRTSDSATMSRERLENSRASSADRLAGLLLYSKSNMVLIVVY